MDPSVRTAGTFLNEDQRWLGNGGQPIGQPRDIILDRSAFDLVTAFPNGFIPSGVALAKVTATGLYIPYVNETTEVQTLTRTSTGGTVTVTVDGETTAAVAASAAGFTAAALQAAINALSNVDDEHTVLVAGSAGGPLTLTFGGLWGGEDMPAVVIDNTSATGGTITAATTTAGGVTTPAGEGVGLGLLFASVPYDRDSTGDLSAALFWSGEVISSFLPAGHGVDAAFRADTPHISYI
jgi:hypothetical protein